MMTNIYSGTIHTDNSHFPSFSTGCKELVKDMVFLLPLTKPTRQGIWDTLLRDGHAEHHGKVVFLELRWFREGKKQQVISHTLSEALSKGGKK